MGVKFSVSKGDVEKIRKILDPLADYPPTVGNNEKFPTLAFLDYELVKDEGLFAATAMCSGAGSLNRY